MSCNNSHDPLQVIGRSRGYSKKELIEYLPRHCNFTPTLIREINKLSDVVLRNMGTPFARKIIKMVKEISLESYRARQFTRTEINNKGVLYGIVLLKHKVIDSVLNYFHERWPQCIICLYNEHTYQTSVINEKGIIREYKSPLNKVVEEVSKNRPVIPYFEDIQFSGREIFKSLYGSQNITERENPRFFKSMIPNKCYELPGMRNGVEKHYVKKQKATQNKTIDDFCFKMKE
ncbi:MAG: DUF4130 domain-containing protein [Candidatus Hermodarchaeota archaeon]